MDELKKERKKNIYVWSVERKNKRKNKERNNEGKKEKRKYYYK